MIDYVPSPVNSPVILTKAVMRFVARGLMGLDDDYVPSNPYIERFENYIEGKK